MAGMVSKPLAYLARASRLVPARRLAAFLLWACAWTGAAGTHLIPVAVLPFEHADDARNNTGVAVAELVFASLATQADICLVERAEMDRILREHALIATTATSNGFCDRVRALTGAKLLVTGKILRAGSERYLVGKVLGTETGMMVGETVQGAASAPLGPLAEELAGKIAALIRARGPDLLAREKTVAERAAALRVTSGAGRRPPIMVRIEVPAPDALAGDTTAEMEMRAFVLGAGFNLQTNAAATAQLPTVMIKGRGTTAFSRRQGELRIVRARLEVRAVELATGRILAEEEQTSLDADLTEDAAARRAFQNAAAALAERLLPKLVSP